MGYRINQDKMNTILSDLSKNYMIYGPKHFPGDGIFANVDTIRYGKITTLADIEFAKKSDYSFKEILLPISETLFYFTENEIKEADALIKGAIIFLRSCDLHSLKRMDTIYLENGAVDPYCNRLRDNTKFISYGL